MGCYRLGKDDCLTKYFKYLIFKNILYSDQMHRAAKKILLFDSRIFISLVSIIIQTLM